MNDSPAPDKTLWWNRVRMLAYISFILAFIETAALIGLSPWIPLATLGSVIGWSYSLWGAVITNYVGFGTWSEIAKQRN